MMRLANGVAERDELTNAVPQMHGEAVRLWGEDVIICSVDEWDNRTTQENGVWLLGRLAERFLHEKADQTLREGSAEAETYEAFITRRFAGEVLPRL